MKIILGGLAFLFILIGCSNGKIELRKTSPSCLVIPEELPPQVDSGFALIDTMAARKQIEKDNYWKMKAKNFNNVLSKKSGYENESSEVYLINTSQSAIFSFTVKIILDDSLKPSRTEIHKANPGEEILLGCSIYLTEEMQIRRQTFKIVGEKKE
jgi:hypothetical protein